MAGLAAGIRAAQYGQKTLIVERHNAPGGLNSFYARGARKFDVGLHAVTNFVPPDRRLAPLNKLCRQLKIPREALDLCPQVGSRIAFPGADLRFGNGIELLESEVARAFPADMEGFRALRKDVLAWLEGPAHEAEPPAVTAGEMLRRHLRSPLLREMLRCPIFYYGSPREHDLPFADFCVLWQAIYEEGFSRPFEGVRVLIRAMLDRYRSLGGERRMKSGVVRLVTEGDRVSGLVLEDGTELQARRYLSTAGLVETARLAGAATNAEPTRRLTFVETMSVLDCPPATLGLTETIVFFNDAPEFTYARPSGDIDLRSGVICVPNNYDYGPGRQLPEGLLRITALADYAPWAEAPEETYLAQKEQGFARLQASALRFLPGVSASALAQHTVFTDMFTPRTIVKYTGHLEGAVYGSPEKRRRGDTAWRNLFLAGTDQGYVGVVGAALSGVTVVNHRVLAPVEAPGAAAT